VKLLFDQNLSSKLPGKVNDLFPESTHVINVALEREDDIMVWEYAQKNNFTIITQDSDFYDLAFLKGAPPKVIWIRSRNVSTNYVLELLKNNFLAVKRFIEDSPSALMELY